MSEICERIQILMKEQDLSYGELASKTGISKSALQRYVTGETPKIPLDRIELIAAALNTTPGYILGWTNAESGNELPTAESVREILGKLFVYYGMLKDGEPLTDELLTAITPAIRAISNAMSQGKE